MTTKELFPTGTTGTPTSPTIDNPSDDDGEQFIAVEMPVTAVGATPSATWIWEGSMDGTNWFPVAYVTDANDTLSVAAVTRTAVGVDVRFNANPNRQYKKYRVRITANLNVTFGACKITFG